MLRTLVFAGLCAVALSAAAFAQTEQTGSAAEAKAMLEKAVAALKADAAQALEMFNSGQGDFRAGDLYVFCANASDGIETAHPTHKGQKLTEQKDVNGFAFGEEIMNTATEGEIREVTYMWPRPDSDTPAEKVTFVTRVEDQVCGVGYYK
jgi:signal transduction histidine kinase